jgi:hypothetical protein
VWGGLWVPTGHGKGRHPERALSAVRVRAITEPGRYADGNGLYLVVDRSGAKRWLLRTVVRGKRCDIGLGGLKLVTLSEARESAATYRKMAREGGDPVAARRRKRAVIPTFAEAARSVHATHAAEAEERDRFFNRPGAGADFVHWSKAAYWTIDEGVALILGRAPDVVNWESVRDYAHVSPFAGRYARLRDLALRAQESGQLVWRTEPRIFLAWAKRTNIEYPSELQEQVMSEAVTDPPQDPPQNVVPKEKPLLVRERDTVLKMLGGIAFEKYGYDPKALRNAAITKIADDLDAAGVHVDAIRCGSG